MKRHLQSLSDDEVLQRMDRELDADRRYFRRRPHRHYRVRRTFPAEFEQLRRRGALVPPEGKRHFTVVHQFYPGCRARRFFGAPAATETNLPDGEAKAWFDWCCRHFTGEEPGPAPARLEEERGLTW